MAVAVVSRTGVPLMPTSPYRARKLLASGKAEKYGYDPFTIRLTERETGDTQPVELCMDTGYIHIGVSVKSEKHEYLALQIDTLTDEKKKHEKCREKRRNRRSRKRYRKPRFDNRKRDKGWLAPSLEHKKEIHVRAAERICRVVPVTDITMEMGNFDTQVLKAREEGRPLPQGTDYQQGERYGTATLREAVFSRDNYTCLCCGRTMKDGAYFHVHHIRYRSQGGTDRMANLATVCEKCHTPANHQPGGKLYNWKPEIKSFKGATFMTAVRWQMYREIKEKIPDISVHLTYGAATKERRRALDIEKPHVNDAFVMGRFHPGHRARPELYIKKRRNNRVLESFYDARYIDSRYVREKTSEQKRVTEAPIEVGGVVIKDLPPEKLEDVNIPETKDSFGNSRETDPLKESPNEGMEPEIQENASLQDSLNDELAETGNSNDEEESELMGLFKNMVI